MVPTKKTLPEGRQSLLTELACNRLNDVMMNIMSLPKKIGVFAYGLFFSAISVLLPACPPQRPETPTLTPSVMTRLSPENYPDFADDMAYDGLHHAIDQSLAYLTKIPEARPVAFGPDQFTSGQLVKALSHFKAFIASNPTRADLNRYIRTNYFVYEAAGADSFGDVLFTGYYEPNLRGSLRKTERYRYPVYARPDNLATIDLSLFSPEYKGKTLTARIDGNKILPYDDRTAIEGGSLEGIAAPIAWVDDQVDLFFLQIQGSGKISLTTGEVLHVHYHVSNGRPYRSIGKLLIEQNKIAKSAISMQTIRAYLKAHPDEIPAIFAYNPSYVFFKTEADGGPLGCLNVRLTPGRSLAVDRRIFPMACLSFIQTQKPMAEGAGSIVGWADFARFVLNQDTGGAIRGTGRADLFWGNGAYAELAAGHMQHHGRLYFLVLKPDAV